MQEKNTTPGYRMRADGRANSRSIVKTGRKGQARVLVVGFVCGQVLLLEEEFVGELECFGLAAVGVG